MFDIKIWTERKGSGSFCIFVQLPGEEVKCYPFTEECVTPQNIARTMEAAVSQACSSINDAEILAEMEKHKELMEKNAKSKETLEEIKGVHEQRRQERIESFSQFPKDENQPPLIREIVQMAAYEIIKEVSRQCKYVSQNKSPSPDVQIEKAVNEIGDLIKQVYPEAMNAISNHFAVQENRNEDSPRKYHRYHVKYAVVIKERKFPRDSIHQIKMMFWRCDILPDENPINFIAALHEDILRSNERDNIHEVIIHEVKNIITHKIVEFAKSVFR
jgi:hypothetical protein